MRLGFLLFVVVYLSTGVHVLPNSCFPKQLYSKQLFGGTCTLAPRNTATNRRKPRRIPAGGSPKPCLTSAKTETVSEILSSGADGPSLPFASCNAQVRVRWPAWQIAHQTGWASLCVSAHQGLKRPSIRASISIDQLVCRLHFKSTCNLALASDYASRLKIARSAGQFAQPDQPVVVCMTGLNHWGALWLFSYEVVNMPASFIPLWKALVTGRQTQAHLHGCASRRRLRDPGEGAAWCHIYDMHVNNK